MKGASYDRTKSFYPELFSAKEITEEAQRI